MPCFRGIEIFFATRTTNEKIPEFPHPDSSSVRVCAGVDLKKPVIPSSLTVPDGIPRSDSVQKIKPTTSVYIPSIPGSTFAVCYDVRQVPSDPCKFLVFRLFVNGRSIASWGNDPRTKPNGFVSRSFWEPCDRFQDNAGIEGRNFIFKPGPERGSIAEDGGLIEVQVYRARDRKARAPRVDTFRSQDKYGILTPSVGLVEQPEELLYYQFCLIDTKDSPFATFKFHYRSWESLELLNLIPTAELELTPKPRKLPNPPIKPPMPPESPEHCHQNQEDMLEYELHDIDSLDGSIHDRYQERQEQRRKTGRSAEEDERQGPVLRTPPRLRPSTPFTRHVGPSKANRDVFPQEYLQRPLPELPLSELPKQETAFINVTRQTSVKSLAPSVAPSVAPSLMQYVDEESFNDDEEIETGVAVAVPISLSMSMNSIIHEETSVQEKQESDAGSSKYDGSPASTERGSVTPQELVSPRNYLPTSGSAFSAFEEGFASLSMARPRNTADREIFEQCQANRMANVVYEDNGTLKVGGLRLCESEWMRRTPSPVHHREGDVIPRG